MKSKRRQRRNREVPVVLGLSSKVLRDAGIRSNPEAELEKLFQDAYGQSFVSVVANAIQDARTQIRSMEYAGD